MVLNLSISFSKTSVPKEYRRETKELSVGYARQQHLHKDRRSIIDYTYFFLNSKESLSFFEQSTITLSLSLNSPEISFEERGFDKYV